MHEHSAHLRPYRLAAREMRRLCIGNRGHGEGDGRKSERGRLDALRNPRRGRGTPSRRVLRHCSRNAEKIRRKEERRTLPRQRASPRLTFRTRIARLDTPLKPDPAFSRRAKAYCVLQVEHGATQCEVGRTRHTRHIARRRSRLDATRDACVFRVCTVSRIFALLFFSATRAHSTNVCSRNASA